MSPKIVDREQRSKQILTAAFELFVKKGYHKTMLNDIAKAAGIGQGTLYYYFPTKDEIFWGVYDMLMSHIEEQLCLRMAKCPNSKEQLQELIKFLFLNFPEVGLFEDSLIKGNPADMKMAAIGFSRVLMEFWLQAERSGKSEQFYQRFSRQQRMFRDNLKHLFADNQLTFSGGLSYETVAHLLIALRDGLSVQLRFGTIDYNSTVFKEVISYVNTYFVNQIQGINIQIP